MSSIPSLKSIHPERKDYRETGNRIKKENHLNTSAIWKVEKPEIT